MRDIGKACRRPRRFAHATEGGFPRLSGSVPRGSRCPASPRHALLAENLGKPSLWVIIKDLWYQNTFPRNKPLGRQISIATMSAKATPAL